MKKLILLPLLFLFFAFLVVNYTRIGTGRYCNESPEVRWKFAIYAGECWEDGEELCSFYKIEDTGLKEYLGLAESELQKQRCYK